MAELYRVEEYNGVDAIRCSIGRVACSFKSDTRKEGTIVECTDGKISTMRHQPDLNMYPAEEQEYMRQATAIVYMLIYGSEHHSKPEYQKV